MVPTNADSKVGVALESLSRSPLNAMRHPPQRGTSGWYVWGGEFSDDPNFFKLLAAKQMPTLVPALVPYLALAPGWRVLLGEGHEELLYDPRLVNL